MKEICQCNCSTPALRYRTPWCSLLMQDSCCSTPNSLLHLWYKIDLLRAETRQRLAYLGRKDAYQNVPDVNDLVGIEPTGTATPLHLSFSATTLQDEAKTMLSYLGASAGHQNLPSIDDLVGGNTNAYSQLMLTYSKATLKEEIEKKTAYLGKFRRTEDSVHLLDLIAMTDDEDDLFVSFAKEAMTDVWTALSAPFVAVDKYAHWIDTASAGNPVGIRYYFGVYYNSSNYEIVPLEQAVLGALVERIIYKWLLYAYPDAAGQYDTNYQQAIAEVTLRCNDFKARAAGVFTPLAKDAMMDVWSVLSAPFVAVSKRAWWQDTATTDYQVGVQYYFDVNYVLTSNDTAALRRTVLEALVARIIYKWLVLAYPGEAEKFDAFYQQALAAIPQRVNEFKARWTGLFVPYAKAAMADIYDALHTYLPRHEKAYFWREGKDTAVFTDNPLPSPAVTFTEGQYVEYNGDLYVAIEDGSSDDFAGKLVPTEDYRDSIHYGIVWRCSSSINAVEPLDVAVFEALVARIIYKWLSYAYPDEAPRYLSEYEEHLDKIRRRGAILAGAQIVNRIPRMF